MLVLEKEEAPLMLVTDKGNRTSFLESVTISEPGKYLKKNDVICYQRIFAGVGEHFGMLQKITIGYFSVTL